MDGFELLHVLRREPGSRRCRAFMCSADAMPDDMRRAADAGFAGYWAKPINIAKILSDLDAALEARLIARCRHPTPACCYAKRTTHSHGLEPTAPRTAVLLCNLGTPTGPTARRAAPLPGRVLSDPRVVEIPRFLWSADPARRDPARAATQIGRKYASVWTAEGSPLKVWTDKQAKLLVGYLGERGQRVLVRPAMRYGNPSIASVLDELKRCGGDHIRCCRCTRSTAPRRPRA
jgi:hypothetical protein